MNVIYPYSSAAMTYGGTYQELSFIMDVSDVVVTLDSTTVLVLEIEITMLYGKLTSALALTDNNISLECSRMN